MPLTNVEIDIRATELPRRVAEYLREANCWADRYMSDLPSIYRGFVPSDYVTVYHALEYLSQTSITSGNSFCEWGSGLGVVTSLAAMLGFDAYGIEIDPRLHEAALELAGQFAIPVELIHGSFIPQGAEELVDRAFAECDGALSLEPDADLAYQGLGLEIRDFDIIFAFPWPNDEALTAELFERYAARGALLLTYSDPGTLLLRRKIG